MDFTVKVSKKNIGGKKMVNRKWYDTMDENSCITFEEWNRMVTWLQDLHDNVNESHCSLGDLGLISCDGIITINNLCDKISEYCVSVVTDGDLEVFGESHCSLGDLGLISCDGIITINNLCDKISEYCPDIGSACAKAGESNPTVNTVTTTNVWNILPDCDNGINIDMGLLSFDIDGDGARVIHGGNNYQSIHSTPSETASLTLVPFGEKIDSSSLEPFTDVISHYPRIMLNSLETWEMQTFNSGLFFDVSAISEMAAPTLTGLSDSIEMRHKDIYDTGDYRVYSFLKFYYQFKSVDIDFLYHEAVIESSSAAGVPEPADIYLKPELGAYVKFGEYEELNSTPTITGYIRMKDSSGKVIRVYCYEEPEDEGGGGPP